MGLRGMVAILAVDHFQAEAGLFLGYRFWNQGEARVI
jgi:hypothetical protein